MADEPEDEDLGELAVEGESDAEWLSTDKYELCFPHGTAWFADTYGFTALRVEYKTGAIEGCDNETGIWRGTQRKPGEVRAIKVTKP